MVHTIDYARKKSQPIRMAVILFLAVVGTLASWSVLSGRLGNVINTPRVPQHNLVHGLVIDQDGDPLAKVEVKVLVSELGESSTDPTTNAAILATQKRFSVWSDQRGRFGVMVPEGYQKLQILELVLPDYEWVKDWAWSSPAYNERSNTNFMFEGKRNIGFPYHSDPDRPAIFPMHQIGNAAPATRPSRGGADGDRKNEPVELIIPSAGPGAPRTPEEINRRIDDHFKAINEGHGLHIPTPPIGYRVTPADIVKVGMTEIQVRRTLGPPEANPKTL